MSQAQSAGLIVHTPLKNNLRVWFFLAWKSVVSSKIFREEKMNFVQHICVKPYKACFFVIIAQTQFEQSCTN